MRTLILCVDRDDDLGEKAKVTSPVVGRKNNLKAVIALGIEDPEDSDANVIFMGLKLLKKYHDMGREVEIATICGDRMVGIQSDANLIRQFYAVVEQFSPDSVVLVSDGAEDEDEGSGRSGRLSGERRIERHACGWGHQSHRHRKHLEKSELPDQFHPRLPLASSAALAGAKP